MAAKVVTAVIVFLLNVAAGVVGFFFLMLALNGFHELEANYGMGAYIILSFVGSVAMTTAAFLTVGWLLKKEYQPIVAALIAIPIFVIVGAGLKLFFVIISAILTGEVRRSFTG
jgi:hydrogenase-4 membrane subunit HyfE